MNRNEENIASLDLLKIILSIMVVVIHVNPRGSDLSFIVYPFIRVTVPLFFIMSSFFVFKKINAAQKKDQNEIIKRFVSRNARLYLAWFVLLLPSVIIVRGYYKVGLKDLLTRVALDVVFGSTFKGSWFLTSLMIAVPVVYVLINTCGWVISGIVCSAMYLLCCIASCYYSFLPENSLIIRIIDLYPGNMYNSFPVALLWVYLGALESIVVNKHKGIDKALKIVAVTSFLLLELEYFVTVERAVSSDCFVMLVPLSLVLFILVYRTRVQANNTRELRTYSTIFYCIHPTIVSILFMLFEKQGFAKTSFIISIIVFALTVILCTIAAYWIIKLSKTPKLTILKNLY